MTAPDNAPPRHHRQTLLPWVGEAGQSRLAAARVLVVGCGALGTTICELLARAGVGRIDVADRDVVEWTNLQRQTLFDESDARAGRPKAVAAARRLGEIDSSITVVPHVLDVTAENLDRLLLGPVRADLLLDGTDNAETRYLANDAAVKHGVPWIYGGCVGTSGRVMAVRPGETACLRCVFPAPPSPGELATCDTAGVLGPAASVVASLQAAEALKLLAGHPEAVPNRLLSIDFWTGRFSSVDLTDAKRPDCPCCGLRQFEFLTAPPPSSRRLCGSDSVQVRPGASRVSLPTVAAKLRSAGAVELQDHLLRCRIPAEGLTLTLFADGRLVVHGTADPNRARSIYARYVGA